MPNSPCEPESDVAVALSLLAEEERSNSVERGSRVTRESLEEMPKHMTEETHLQGTPRFPKRCLPALMHMVPTSGTIRKPSEGKRAGGLATAHSAHQ